MMGRLHADIFFQDRYMLNEVNVKIKFVLSKDVFCIMSDADCRLMITKAAMFVRKVKLSPSVFLAHAKALESGTAKYPIRRVVCKTFTVPTGFRDISHDKIVFRSTADSRRRRNIVVSGRAAAGWYKNRWN